MVLMDMEAEDRVRQNDRAHVFHSWSAQGAITPLPIARAQGSRFWDYDGKDYLDFSSGLVHANIGYGHPKLVAAVQEQAGRMATIAPGYAVDVRSEAARLIASKAPDGLEMVFFTNGGAEATENAIRMARLHTGRHKVFAAYRSYHGATAGALTMTGDPRRIPSEPGLPGTLHFWGPYPYRSAFHSTSPEQETERALGHLRDMIMVEGPSTVAAIILETIVGTNGILVPPAGYLEGVRAICDEFGIIMIADEVMAGFGRIGEWYAVQHWNVTPDLITFAKGVNSGYVPLGGVVISREIAETFRDRPYPGGLTYSGHPLACASAVASIQIFEDEDILKALGLVPIGSPVSLGALLLFGRAEALARWVPNPRAVAPQKSDLGRRLQAGGAGRAQGKRRQRDVRATVASRTRRTELRPLDDKLGPCVCSSRNRRP